MARVIPVFFDTSILLAGTVDLGPSARPAQLIMTAIAERRVRRPDTAWHCCLEFYSVATRLPPELRLAPRDALRLLEEEIVGRFRIHQLPERARDSFLRESVRERVMGGRIYDAHVAEIARRNGAKTVVTDNLRHFTVLERHGIRVLTGAEFASTLSSAGG